MPNGQLPNGSSMDLSNYEQLIGQVEQIARQLRSGKLGLDSSLKEYEQGVHLLVQCRQYISEARRRIEVLKGVDLQGNAQTVPMDDTELDLQQKAEARSSRRGYAKSASTQQEDTTVPATSTPKRTTSRGQKSAAASKSPEPVPTPQSQIQPQQQVPNQQQKVPNQQQVQPQQQVPQQQWPQQGYPPGYQQIPQNQSFPPQNQQGNPNQQGQPNPGYDPSNDYYPFQDGGTLF